jgi:hypothetical protein
MEQIEPVKSKKGTQKNKPQLTPEEKKKRQQMYSKKAYEKFIATHGSVRKHKKTAEQLQAQQRKLEEKQLEEENQFLQNALKQKNTRGKLTEERKQLLKELKETLTPEEYEEKRKETYNQEHADEIKKKNLQHYYENRAIINKKRAERERKKRANMNAGPDAFENYVPTQEHNSNSSLPNNMNPGPDAYVPSHGDDANYSLPNNMNPGPDAFENYVQRQEDNANSSSYEDYFSDIENANIVLEHPESRVSERGNGLNDFYIRKNIMPTPEEKLRQQELKKTLPPEEYKKALNKFNKEKNKSRKKEQDQKRHAENKERLNKERVERARIQREKEREQKREEQFAQNMIELSEALGQNNMNAGPMPTQEHNANSSLPNNMNAGPDAFDYIPHYEEDPNSILYDEQFSDIEEDANSALGKRDRSKSPVSENKRTNVLNEKDFNIDDLKEFDGGRKTRKRRKTKKNKKRH